MSNENYTNKPLSLVLGNSNKRFSGVTSTMLQVLPIQQKLTNVAVVGAHHLPQDARVITLRELAKISKAQPKPLVFHARRNDEIIQALLAKKLLGANIKIAFTSTAQRFHSKFTKWLMRQCDAIISTSHTAAAYLTDNPADILVSHGVDTTFYHPCENKKQAQLDEGIDADFCIGIFGRVRASKGIDVLVQAAIPVLKDHPRCKVIICGECKSEDQTFQQQLESEITKHQLTEQFIFLGKQPFDRIPRLMRAMNVVAALSRNEGFGLTPLEAMASGTAVLTSEAGAWKELFDDGVHGYRTATGDVQAVRQFLRKLVENPDATDAFGVNGRKHVLQHYTVEQEAQQLTEYLLSLAKD